MTAAGRSTRLRRSSTSLVLGDITASYRSTRLSYSSPSPPRAQGDMTDHSSSSRRSSPSPPRAEGDMIAPRSSSCHRPSSPSPAGENPLDDDNLFGEILVRMSPQPPCRVRASSVSKRWKTTINNRDFLKRFRSHHRKPPLLGILTGHKYLEYLVHFIPIEIDGFKIPFRHFSLREDRANNVTGWELVDCRHGFALFEDVERRQAVIWDPVGDTFENVSIPQEFQNPNIIYRHWEVLCTDKTEGHVHGCCHRSPRKVVLVAIYQHQGREVVIAGVYSGKWDSIIHKTGPLVGTARSVGRPSILIGNTLNWLLTSYDGYYIQFDLCSQSVSVIHCEIRRPHFARLIHSEETDGGLALADLVFPLNGSPTALQIWENKDESGVAIWVLVKSIPLVNLPNLECMPEKWCSYIVCYAEDAHTIFMNLHRMVYMVDLKTEEVSFICGEDLHCPCHAFTSWYFQDEAKIDLP